CWDNCATLICELSDERLEALIPRLLVWLQDLNWPGACAIRNRLMALPISMLKRPLEITALYADLMNDDMWIEFLSAFSDHKALMAAFDPEARRILESARDANGQDLNGVPR
ncbi:MAG: DUF5071 domain-containing protein, partial [Clostridiales bacterium]|nr:DUF5071 domain-containing protein [Clostridiales bacterium]